MRKYLNFSLVYGAAVAVEWFCIACLAVGLFCPLFANAQYVGPIYNPLKMGPKIGAGLSTVTVNSNADLLLGAQDTSLVQITNSAMVPNSNGAADLGSTTKLWRKLYVDFTNTATIGAVTINKASGRVRIAAAGTSVVVTNSLATVASHIFCNVSTNDATALGCRVQAAAGSFTIRTNVATTATTDIDFFIVNAD